MGEAGEPLTAETQRAHSAELYGMAIDVPDTVAYPAIGFRFIAGPEDARSVVDECVFVGTETTLRHLQRSLDRAITNALRMARSIDAENSTQ